WGGIVTPRIRLPMVALGATLALAASGCGPKRSAALDEARGVYDQARRDPAMAQNAPVQLHEAEQELARAERNWREDHDEAEAAHLAYLTERRVDIARATAEQNAADREVEELHARRPEVLLGARTEEAARAEARARELEEELQARKTDRGTVVTLSDV